MTMHIPAATPSTLTHHVTVTQGDGERVTIWTGFSSLTDRRVHLEPGHVLVIAWFDGEPDLWVADGEAGIQELRRAYREDWGDRDIPFDTFTARSADR